jgi:peptidoglycan/xylan/chitin deacetylase (PgdA/CDA1 family)
VSSVAPPVLQRLARTLRTRRSVILCYHGVGPTSTSLDPGFLRVRPEVFRAQLELLLGAGFEFVTVAELADRAAGAEPPHGLASLSFDDGMDDNHAVVLPILTELGLTATVYVATGLIGKPNPWMAPGSGARMMDEPELRELVAAGFEIGAHSVTHPDLSQLDYESCLREMTESRHTLERIAGAPVRTFAYPFCRFGPAALAAVRASGFSAAVTCQGSGSWDRYELKRSLITGKDGLPIFLLKLTDAYEPLFDSRPSRLVRAATRRLRDRLRERAQERRAGG